MTARVGALLCMLLLAGCSSGGGGEVRRVASGPPAPRTITVQPGDTIADLARRYDVAMRDLIDANNLQAPYAVAPGTRLRFPVPRDYVVQPGDSLYGISRLFAVDQREIVRLNQLREPYDVKPGQTLRLPVRDDAPATRLAAAAAPVAAAPIVATPLPAQPQPQPQPQKQATTVAAPPPRSSATVLAPPTPIVAPNLAAPATSAPAAPQGVASAAIPTMQAPPAAAVAPSLPEPQPQPQVAAVAPPAPKLDDVPAPAGARFVQPVAGKLLSGYGPKPDGLHNDGINIAAPLGTPVKAADRGTVVYAGNELRGFGNLVLLKHEDGYVTAYAHLDRIDVAKGATVARGQRIGTVGKTGSVSEPQLHFELRRGAKAIDPSDALKSG